MFNPLMIGGIVACILASGGLLVLLYFEGRRVPTPVFAYQSIPVEVGLASLGTMMSAVEKPETKSGYVGRHREGFICVPIEYASGIDYATYQPTFAGAAFAA